MFGSGDIFTPHQQNDLPVCEYVVQDSSPAGQEQLGEQSTGAVRKVVDSKEQ